MFCVEIDGMEMMWLSNYGLVDGVVLMLDSFADDEDRLVQTYADNVRWVVGRRIQVHIRDELHQLDIRVVEILKK